MRKRHAALGGLLAALLVAGPAAAQEPDPATTAIATQAPGAAPAPAVATPPAPAVAPAPPAVAPVLLRTSLLGTHQLGRRGYLVQGERLKLRGVLRPYAPGQRVTVRVYRGSHRLLARTLRVRAVRGTSDGAFTLAVPANHGRLVVRAVHPATAELGAIRAPQRSVTVLRAAAGPGDRGPLVRLLQGGLDRLAYAVPLSGSFDDGTARAVIAFRKVNGMARTTGASSDVVGRVLAGHGAFKPRYPRAGRHLEADHLEADLSRQVLALIDGGKVRRTYHTSSGAPATPTIIGSFRVYRKDLGTNSLGMVDASYFRGGYAVHGYASVPTYNASHGCLRVPIPDARHIYDWLHMGDGVIVYP